MPAERLQAREGAGRKAAPAATHQQVGDDIGHADEDDQVAERHDLIGDRERDRVTEPGDGSVVVGDLTRPGQHDAVDLVGFDHPGFDQRLGTNGGGSVERDRRQVGDDPDADDGHADQEQVADDEGERSDEAGDGPPAGGSDVETIDDHTDRDGDHEQRERHDAGSGDGTQPPSPGDADDESDDDGQNHGRESHRRILPVVPADRRRA